MKMIHYTAGLSDDELLELVCGLPSNIVKKLDRGANTINVCCELRALGWALQPATRAVLAYTVLKERAETVRFLRTTSKGCGWRRWRIKTGLYLEAQSQQGRVIWMFVFKEFASCICKLKYTDRSTASMIFKNLKTW